MKHEEGTKNDRCIFQRGRQNYSRTANGSLTSAASESKSTCTMTTRWPISRSPRQRANSQTRDGQMEARCSLIEEDGETLSFIAAHVRDTTDVTFVYNLCQCCCFISSVMCLHPGAVRASSIFPILSVILLFMGGLCIAASEFYKSRHNIILSAGILFVSAGVKRERSR